MIKTFREVIRDIKVGEVWKGEWYTISMVEEGSIRLAHKEGFNDSDIALLFEEDSLYELEVIGLDFSDVLSSDKKCTVSHPKCKNYGYTSLDVLLSRLAFDHDATALRDIIQNGVWYLGP